MGPDLSTPAPRCAAAKLPGKACGEVWLQASLQKRWTSVPETTAEGLLLHMLVTFAWSAAKLRPSSVERLRQTYLSDVSTVVVMNSSSATDVPRPAPPSRGP